MLEFDLRGSQTLQGCALSAILTNSALNDGSLLWQAYAVKISTFTCLQNLDAQGNSWSRRKLPYRSVSSSSSPNDVMKPLITVAKSLQWSPCKVHQTLNANALENDSVNLSAWHQPSWPALCRALKIDAVLPSNSAHCNCGPKYENDEAASPAPSLS